MIKLQWEKLVGKIDSMTLRERVMVFATAALLLVSLIYALLLDPLLLTQKKFSMQLIQQQEKIKEIQSQLESLVQAKANDASSPLRDRIKQVQQQIKAGEIELKSRHDKLVPPEKMGDLLESMLSKNGRLQLVGLETLAVTPLIETSSAKPEGNAVTSKPAGPKSEVYKHGVKLTVRGSYADVLQYLEALEQLPMQMFWGSAKMTVVQFPSVEMTLTLYTLSLDTIWLQV
jgi:MSHA biogenesis protein MshJ